jgi:hypothetical protein
MKYSKRTLIKGAREEYKEHRLGWKLSKKIAKDHLKESPLYYLELSKMEKRLKRKRR